ncbi:methyl-accepting chemotaxis sensory transducer with Cache sensor [Kineothrix alysoides]|uniref:Methyl-accepting chemotaxis sensory transducer with Cache sensor n=1 Tax=Kineothrix alysoides TaxID=1469948 RepID=A0A4R1R3H4_9FIRM|nr:methyl-accepting chemotaxis protein [Kineothrix alysoides]TCL59928.1 methyl-accepting chemotaxis sensory transducer with Cache sensor [Kineothrix alysoides]
MKLNTKAKKERNVQPKPPEGKKRKQDFFLSIRTKITFVLVIFILLSVSVNYNYLSNLSKDTLTSYTEATLLEIVEAQNNYIEQSIEKYNSTLTYLNGSENFYVYNTNHGKRYYKEVHAALNKYMTQNPTHESINFVDAETLSLLGSTDTDKEGTDYSGEVFINYIMENRKPAQSNVFLDDATGEPLISIGVPQASHIDEDTQSGVMFTTVKASLLSDTLSDIRVFNSDTSYAYLLDTNGTYIYHPDKELIGKRADTPLISQLVADIGKGTIPEAKVVTDNSTGQYIAYNISNLNHWILCIAVHQDSVLAPIDEMRQSSVNISIIIVIIMSVLGYIFATTITTPIKVITKIVRKTADLDISQDDSYHYLLKKKDETGSMGRAVSKMRQAFSSMMHDISSTSDIINTNSSRLLDIANTMNDNASTTSSAAEQLSSSMESTAENTESISRQIQAMGGNTASINEKATQGVGFSDEIMKRAIALRESTLAATEKTKAMYETVKADTQSAIDSSKSVSKINEMTKTIMEISSQTSLLSLNASIEAARAGEAGRGFSVVASEIGKLADQSSKTVTNITAIVAEVNTAIDKMTSSLTATLDFLNRTVLADYQSFVTVSEQYSQDAGFINRTMSDIDLSIDDLNNMMIKIADSIHQINIAINETTQGVSVVATNNAQTAALTADTYHMVETTLAQSDKLKEMVNNFTLD